MCTRRQRFALCHVRLSGRRILTVTILLLCVIIVCVVLLYRKTTPTIFIIEEHHEALAYWFHAADQGLIPKQGNTLIHIDGHSDESTPEHVTGMPLFRYPLDGDEMSYFLQKNDVFIQGAVMSGIVSRVIWIWPSWDESLLEQKPPYELKLVELGWYWEESGKNHSRELYFCQCETARIPFLGYRNSKKCSFLNNSAATVEEQDIEMPPESCHIETSYVSEHINEQHFFKKISQDHKWIREDENVILDIDEDYFGCENVANSLTRDDLSWSAVESIDQLLQHFLCPKVISHEEVGNNFLKLLLQPYLKNCRLAFSDARCSSANFITQLLIDAYNILVSEFRHHPSLFCGHNDYSIRNAWKALAEVFHKMPPHHVQRIYDMGFCLSTTPKTLFFEAGRADLTVCHGLNQPNATIVYLHTPDKMEIAERSKLLLKITQSIFHKRSLSLVTLCRSVRDGFTPRELADFIEAEILEILHKVSDEEWEINYDDDLLGGRMGWKSRAEMYN